MAIRTVSRVVVTFDDGTSRTFDVDGHYRTRENLAAPRNSSVHNQEPERAGAWIEHEVWWRA